jgi:hypothetical protein
MCSPTLALSAGATLLGARMKQDASDKAQRMAGMATEDFGRKNLALETEGRDALGKTRDMFERNQFDTGQEDTTARLAALFNDATGVTRKTLPTQSGAPQIVQDAVTNEMAKAQAFNQQQGAAAANLQGFGDYLANTMNPAMNQSAEVGQMMGNMMGGNANVLQADLRNAKNKAQSPMGDLLQLGGSLGTQYGLFG